MSKDCKGSVAVIGSGISGISTAWMLSKNGYNVTLFEAENRLGGHSLTFHDKNGPPVDLGFQVFNFTTYPYLTAFLDELEVDHEPSDMSFSLSVDDGRLEWASHNLGSVFAQPKNARSPRFLGMVKEMFRFARQATEVLDSEEWSEKTLGEYLKARQYSESFIFEYLLPMTAAVWSVPNKTMLEFPVVPMIRFWDNHHLLNPLGDRPLWRVVKDRSEQYIKKAAKQIESFGSTIKLGSPVDKITRNSKQGKVENVVVSYHDSTGSHEATFDQIVLACHSNQALSILGSDATKDEQELLGAIKYQPNDVYLHSDESQMPKLKKAWASWNVLDKSADNTDMKGERNICVTYWLNNLQNLDKSAPLRLCTLNPIVPPKEKDVICKMVLEHPVFSMEAINAQNKINRAQAGLEPSMGLGHKTNTWFAGAYLGSGFHEDGLRSAVAVADALNSAPDWVNVEHPGLNLVRGPSPNVSWSQSAGLSLFKSVASKAFQYGHLRIMLPNGHEMLFGRNSAKEASEAGEPHVIMRILNLDMLMKCVSDGDIGVGEAYMDKWFETDNLLALFDLLLINRDQFTKVLFSSDGVTAALSQVASNMSGVISLVTSLLSWMANKTGTIRQYMRHLSRANTVAGSRRNIEEHYDLGNDMYELFLDETMTYSSGIHTKACGAVKYSTGEMKVRGPTDEPELSLYDAQLAKLDAIIQRANLQESDHVLEIGCGWGSFAIRAASTIGCKVTGITISTEQLAMAKKRVVEAGLEEKVNLIICDYRKLGLPGSEYAAGSFDKIVSIEMLEAVGHEHLPQYFEVVDRMLKPQGNALIQVISMPDDRYEEYINSSDFIRRHIFPGGHLPCIGALEWATRDTQLTLENINDIGPDYAITLRMWRERFEANHDKIIALGYPERFYRKFIFYFAYCEAGFTNRYIYDWHLSYKKASNEAGLTVEQAAISSKALNSGVNDPTTEILYGRADKKPMLDKKNLTWTHALLLLWIIGCSSVIAMNGNSNLLGIPVIMGLTWTLQFLVSKVFLPSSIRSTSEKALQWSNNSIAFLASALVSLLLFIQVTKVGGLGQLFGDKIYMSETESPSLVNPQLILYVASGYYVADLFSIVYTKLWKSNIARIGYLTGVLVAFSTAMVRGLCLPYLSIFLVVEVNELFLRLRALLALNGVQMQSKSYQATWTFIGLSTICARVVPHAWLFKQVVHDEVLYSLTNMHVYWVIASAGMFMMNMYNIGVCIASLNAFQLDYANGWNTDVLLDFKEFKRSKEELIEVMSETKKNV